VKPHALDPLLSPRSIAFVGASGRLDTPGNDMMRMVRAGGFKGVVVAVNPGYREIEGYPCVASLSQLTSPPDLVVLSVKNERLEEALKEAVAAGAKAAVIFASAQLGHEAEPTLSQRLAKIARDAGMPVCGPNCMGFYNDLDNVWICGFPSPRRPEPGTIALIAHSGSVFGALAHNDPRLKFALAISPGQELTTGMADYISYAVDRPEVKVVGLFIEAAREPAEFRAALAKAAERQIPIVALKVGRTEASAKAALTHTGAIVGSDATYEALFDRYGVIRVDTIDEFAATLMLLSTGRKIGPGALVSIHDSGGEREMIIDLAEQVGVPFATIDEQTRLSVAAHLDPGLEADNPLDAWGTGKDFVAQFETCFHHLISDRDAAIGIFAADIRDGYYLHQGFADATKAVALRTTKPIALVTNYTQVRHDVLASMLVNAGVPVLDGTANALRAVRGALAYRDFLERRDDKLADLPGALEGERDSLRRELKPGTTLGESASLAVLSAWGIPTVRHDHATSESEVTSIASRIGYPVALKTATDGISHKSDVGGVVLGIKDEDALLKAYRQIASKLGNRVVVAAMLGRGVELSLGMVRDPQFGPVVMIGAGGVLVELLSDHVSALAPFGPETARRLLGRLRVRKLLGGVRGQPPVNIDTLAAIISRFSVLCDELGDLVIEIDINPLICGAEIVAADALVVTGGV
jgi:acyl-CoA synthetase (NDP forming)